MSIMTVSISHSYAEHNVLLLQLELGVGYFLAVCRLMAEAPAKARNENISCRRAINFKHSVLNLQRVDSWWIFTACAVEISVFKGAHNRGVV